MNDDTLKEREDTRARSNFLIALDCLAGKYGIDYHKDIDIDFETMGINIKTDMEDRKLLAFIAELEKLTGRWE
jgi:hypothetical protein